MYGFTSYALQFKSYMIFCIMVLGRIMQIFNTLSDCKTMIYAIDILFDTVYVACIYPYYIAYCFQSLMLVLYSFLSQTLLNVNVL